MSKRQLPIGIDAMSVYLPKIYLDIKALSDRRGIPYDKLSRGLGLIKMAIPDAHEDAATMAAEAIAELVERNNLDPRRIGRIYFGTESALDMAKPTGTYTVEMLEQRFVDRFGRNCFRHCDVVDMTFACIGAVDALHNTLDWVASDPDHVGIVVASDIAKYELGSSGEYTQGAGAVAMLVRWHPRLLVIRRVVGVAMESVHDFYKPRRDRFTETPVFDGQYSNLCYIRRMNEAMDDFRERAVRAGLFKPLQFRALSERWTKMIFHLPYAFHARRMYLSRFVEERKAANRWERDLARFKFVEPQKKDFPDANSFEKAESAFLKSVSETVIYRQFVHQKLEQAQQASMETGNLYTASIFLALMSMFELSNKEGNALRGKRIGFIAYGSGSKSKVFEGIVQPRWQAAVSEFRVFEKLADRRPIDYDQYEQLHQGTLKEPVMLEQGRYVLASVGKEGVTLGARYYAASH
jgi:hydroxymethylglutaryl-CoA synthase